MTTNTVIINGFARAGKDSFVDACALHLHAAGKWAYTFSSIDPVRNLLINHAGVDLSAKTDADRKLLANVGAALEEHSNWRTNACISFVLSKRSESDVVLFLHIREPENIAKVMRGLGFARMGWDNIGPVHTLLLRGPREIMPDNVADNSVLGMDYGDTIHNDGDLVALSDKAHAYLKSKGVM